MVVLPGLLLTILSLVRLSFSKEVNPSSSAGCQLATLPGGFGNKNIPLSIKSGGKARTFHVFIPELYQPGVPTPLILSFHGRGKTAEEQQALAGFSTNDDPNYNPGWIVVTPQGLSEAWEGAPYATPNYSDVNFTADLLDYLESNLCIDTSRIYAAGKSNGGGFVGKLACSPVSARIAAYAPVSGAFYTNVSVPCNPSRPIIPIIDFHGMADTTIPYYGGNNSQGYWLDSIPEVMRAWATRQGCPAPPAPTHVYMKIANTSDNSIVGSSESEDEYWRSDWSCGMAPGTQTTIVAYNISGLKHAWPSTQPNDDSTVPTFLNATPLIVKFFQSWTVDGPA